MRELLRYVDETGSLFFVLYYWLGGWSNAHSTPAVVFLIVEFHGRKGTLECTLVVFLSIHFYLNVTDHHLEYSIIRVIFYHRLIFRFIVYLWVMNECVREIWGSIWFDHMIIDECHMTTTRWWIFRWDIIEWIEFLFLFELLKWVMQWVHTLPHVHVVDGGLGTRRGRCDEGWGGGAAHATTHWNWEVAARR